MGIMGGKNKIFYEFEDAEMEIQTSHECHHQSYEN